MRGMGNQQKTSKCCAWPPWQGRSLAGKLYIYLWVDGVYFESRLEADYHCILVIMGTDLSVHKELIDLSDGYWEGEQSWKELLLDRKSHGL
jgi:putative transposase